MKVCGNRVKALDRSAATESETSMETQAKTFQGSFQSGHFSNPLKVFNQVVLYEGDSKALSTKSILRTLEPNEVLSDLVLWDTESLDEVRVIHEISLRSIRLELNPFPLG